MEYLFEVIGLIILLMVSAFFSGSETAIFHLPKITVEKLGSRFQIIRYREKLLGTILLGNTLVNIGVSIIATRIFYKIFGLSNQAILTGIITYIILVVGEFSPKLYSLRNAEKVSIKAMPVLNLIRYIFLPITEPINAIIQIISSKPLPHILITREELKVLAEYQAENASITETEKEFILNLLEFKSKKVVDIMTPAEKIEAISSSELHNQVSKGNLPKLRHSRIPIYLKPKTDTQNLQIVGILYLKDLLNHSRPTLRKPHFVQEDMEASTLLSYFKREKVHIAIVIDKQNNIKGLVTLDDIFNSIIK